MEWRHPHPHRPRSLFAMPRHRWPCAALWCAALLSTCAPARIAAALLMLHVQSMASRGAKLPIRNVCCSCCAGLTSCRICRAGTRPTKSDAGLLGNDMCTACTDNTYRAASSNR